MDHLKEYGSIDIAVPLVTEERHCTPIESLADFYRFPEKNGWSVREKDYALNELRDFKDTKRLSKADLLQSWLFFGLIFFVVRDENGPTLKFEELLDLDSPKNRHLNTHLLPEALQKWEKWELKSRETAKVRMVRAELALEYAHRIVRKNCASDSDDSGGVQAISRGEPDYLSEEVSLSLMVLGETLTAAKARVLDSLGSRMRGWHKDDEGGWGPPRYVIEQMKKKKWCPRTIHLLQGQLGSNATLLLAAFESHKTVEFTDDHRRKCCTKDECLVISEGDADEHLLNQEASLERAKTKYQPKHVSGCPKNSCTMVGPDMAKVYEILREQTDNNEGQRFPILEVREANNALELDVRTWTLGEDIPFATISHVWSDGLGNEDGNEIYDCQLKFIKSLLTKVVAESSNNRVALETQIPFWMDTLLIPVRSADGSTDDRANIDESRAAYPVDFDDLKRRAIRQIKDVFHASTHSIVIDGGLLDIDSRGTPWKNVMKILASGWMRRLWTLQEAYLSKQLWITFKQGEPTHTGMENFDDLIRRMKTSKETFGSSMAEMARLKLFHNVMGSEREQHNGGKDPKESGGAILVANTWRAARWRTTSNPAHETLALATLLSLNYRRTTINEAGLMDRREAVHGDRLETMMCDFWRTLNEKLPGSIPPGMIFLPGERLSEKGFRWAPRTWMSAVEVDHPDPLNNFNASTALAPGGLLVQYPGFLLHCQERKTILGTDHNNTTFTFPIDRDLLEWYSVEPADKKKQRNAYLYQILEQSNGKQTELAIILSRSRPKEMPPEIGLLVEIYEQDLRQREGERKKVVYCCRIIHRVRVWRAKPLYGHGHFGKADDMEFRGSTSQSATQELPSILQTPSSSDSQICIGEIIDPDQQWLVDSFDPTEPPEPEKSAESEESLSEPVEASSSAEPPTSTPPGASAPGGGGSQFVALLSILWKRNPNSHLQPSGSDLPPPEETISTTGDPRPNLRPAATFSPQSPTRSSTFFFPASFRRFTEGPERR